MKDVNKNYNDIIPQFLLNTMLRYLSMSWIIEKNQQLEYEIDKHNPYWITVGPWYNTSICKNYMEQCFKYILEMQELTYINLCVILMHIRNRGHNFLMTVAILVVMHYHKMRQQKH